MPAASNHAAGIVLIGAYWIPYGHVAFVDRQVQSKDATC